MYSGQPLHEQGPFSSFTSWDTQLFHRQQGWMGRDTLMLHVMQISIFVLYTLFCTCIKTAGVVYLPAISLSAAY